MSLPAVGDEVTVLFNGDASWMTSSALYGKIGKVVAEGQMDIEPYVWWKPDDPHETSCVIRPDDEGVYWMRGAGPEVEKALLASFTLWNSSRR